MKKNLTLKEMLFVYRQWTYIVHMEQITVVVPCHISWPITPRHFLFPNDHPPKVSMASTLIFSDSSISILLRSYGCAKTAILGCGHFQAFRLGFSIWHIRHIVRHGHFTLKRKLSVLNKMHTNSYTCPRLQRLQWYWQSCFFMSVWNVNDFWSSNLNDFS